MKLRAATLFAASLAAANAQTWYGIAPDTRVAGKINVFTMTADAQPLAAVGSVQTTDNEYPKGNTWRCSWASPMCFFITGQAGPQVQDAVYGFNRATGATVFKHTPPAGIYLDNLLLNWVTDQLISVAFNPVTGANIVSYNGTTGEVTILSDITADLKGGAVQPGTVTLCPTTNTLYVGVRAIANDGDEPDGILAYDLGVTPPKLNGGIFLAAPIAGTAHAFCNATNLVALTADYIMNDGIADEKIVLGDYLRAGAEGFFFSFSSQQLPTFTTRGEIALFLGPTLSEFNGTFIVTAFPPFTPGPGPAPTLPGGVVWTWTYTGAGARVPGRLTPIGYYLAGAAGVPGK